MPSTPPSDPLFESLAISSDAQSSPLAQLSSDTVKGEFDPLSALRLGVAVASGGGGEGSSGTLLSNLIQDLPGLRLGESVVYITDPSQLCCGLVGNSGTKFCIKANDCKTVTHSLVMRKYTPKPGLYILVDNKSRTCFISPFLDTSSLDSSLIEKILLLKLDLEDLRKEFILIKSQDGSKVSDIESFARPNLSKTVAFKTPSKNRDLKQELQPTNLTETVSNLVSSTEDLEFDLTTKIEDPTELNRAVVNLTKKSDMMTSFLPVIAGVVDSLELSVLEKTNLLYGGLQQIKQLEGAIGSQTNLVKNLKFDPTLWGSISEIISLFQNSETKFDQKNQEISEVIKLLVKKIEDLEKMDNHSLKDNVFKLLKGWKTIIENLGTRVNRLEKEKIAGTVDTSRNPFISLGINHNDPLPSSAASTTNVNATNYSEELLDGINKRLEKVEKHHLHQGKDGLKGSVRFSGVTFTGTNDVGAWLDKSWGNVGSIPPYGLFADPQLLLHWIWILLSGTTNSSAKDMKDRISIEMTQDKTYAVDSYQHYIPLVYTGKKSSLLNTGGMDKSRLGQIPTFDSWDDATGENGLKQQIAEGLSLVKHSISDLIDETFEHSPDVRAFALGMLHASSSFIENLGTYMSETYNNFKDVVGNEKSVWGLVTFVVEQIFRKDFGQVRAKTIGAIDANNRTSGIKIIWSSIRCVDVAQEFMSHGIKNAPAVSASYVRFVITHSNMGKVSALLQDNQNLKRKISELETSVTSIKKVAEMAKKVADSAMSKISSSPTKKKKKTSESDEAKE
jgi:hypothetical protein